MLSRVLDEVTQHARVHLRGVVSAARPFVAALLARKSDRPLVWILASEDLAEQAIRDIRLFFEGDRDSVDPFGQRPVAFPLHQRSPYEDLSPDPDATAERLALLFRLAQGAPPPIVITSIPSLLRRCPPRRELDAASQLVLEGQEIDRAALSRSLARAGYLRVPLVEDPGQFAIRGGIIDIFTPLLERPVRIELLGDEVERIRAFDPGSQRTIYRMDCVYICPVREILLDQVSARSALGAVEQRAGELDVPSHRLLSHTRALREGVRYFGIESLLPAFFPQLSSLLDYLPDRTRLLVDDVGALLASAKKTDQELEESYDRVVQSGHLAFPPSDFALRFADIERAIETLDPIFFGPVEQDAQLVDVECSSKPIEGLGRDGQGKEEEPIGPLLRLLKTWRRDGMQAWIVSARTGRARQTARMLQERGLNVRQEESLSWQMLSQHTPKLFARIVPGSMGQGFEMPIARLAFLPDSEIFGRASPRRRARHPLRALLALEAGQRVVHMDFGIGRFDGLVKLELSGSEADYLQLSYRGGDRLYLPVTRLGLLERYAGPEDKGPLSKLGGKSWLRTRKRIQQALLAMADEVVRTEAMRRSLPGIQAIEPDENYRDLELSFPFEETEDQQQTIREVLGDMARPHPMDRLICGDVGFGKTEVAIRAAFLSCLSGHQAAVLVPTTILALQHLSTFRARLAGQAVEVAMLSRLTRRSEVPGILARLASGEIDIIVGTHRLLTEDISFRSLGLLVIDEEHRFGVRHKEQIKKLKRDVDVLTMTATPLPRTLQMSLSGLRDISVISTPPPGRRAIRTVITRFSERAIEEAIRTELQRGGQVFFLHNFVRSIPAMARFLERVVPEIRLGVSHGQMRELQLERVMSDFVQRKIDVLLCTSIIESGLDIPTANTVIVNRADRFGLAQLYQIRGRVGRSSARAYAYFLIPGLDLVTKDARKRLEALADHSALGSGYQIASRDMEIRGAGNLLGKEQSGHIKAVGFDLYSRLLERAVAEVKGQEPAPGDDPEIQLPLAGYLPEFFVDENQQRIDFYARLSRALCEEEVFEIEQEMVDRYGPLPVEAANLVELMALKSQLRFLLITKLEIRDQAMTLQLNCESARFDSHPFVKLVEERPEARLDPKGQLVVGLSIEERRKPMAAARSLVAKLMMWKGG